MSMKEQLPTLTDKRLEALAFNVWRIAEGGNERRQKKAIRLRPLLRAEIDARAARSENRAQPTKSAKGRAR